MSLVILANQLQLYYVAKNATPQALSPKGLVEFLHGLKTVTSFYRIPRLGFRSSWLSPEFQKRTWGGLLKLVTSLCPSPHLRFR
jgi:hypothetical protein